MAPARAHAAAMGNDRTGWRRAATAGRTVWPVSTRVGNARLDEARRRWHCGRMAVTLVARLRALWLVCLLVLAPVGPLGLVLSGHATGQDAHVTALVHDAADHGLSGGALPDRAPDRHCLFCQTASSLRFGWVETPGTSAPPARRRSPGSTCRAGPRVRIRARLCRPAHRPPTPDRPSGRHFISSTTKKSEFRVPRCSRRHRRAA